jgi:hypothetical protein
MRADGHRARLSLEAGADFIALLQAAKPHVGLRI